MMKKIRFVFLVITLCCMSSCEVVGNINSKLSKSQNKCLEYNQMVLSDTFEAYRIARLNNNVDQTIDSVVTAISSGKDRDTVFVIETCNPPLFSYYAIIWDKDNVFTLSRSGRLKNDVVNENDIKVMQMIERWDKEEILSKSHEKPFIYYGEWPNTRIASRIMMSETDCVSIESVLFSAIDFDMDVVPTLIE